MIGLDTNVLVRILVADDVKQAQQARRVLVETCSVETPAFVNLIVLCELVWTLDRTYGFKSAEIAMAVEQLLVNPVVVVENRVAVEAALRMARTASASLPDALIAQVNRANSCEETLTFDRRAARLDGFRPI